MTKTYPADLKQLSAVAADIKAFCAQNGMEGLAFALNLSADELFTNTVTYGCRAKTPKKISITLTCERGGVKMVIEDDACRFDPFSVAEPEVGSGVLERKVGGLGVFFVRKHMDEFSYEYKNGKNIVTLFKKS